MVGRKNVYISLWWATMLSTLRTTGLDRYRLDEWFYFKTVQFSYNVASVLIRYVDMKVK